jgi:hypothetical protein
VHNFGHRGHTSTVFPFCHIEFEYRENKPHFSVHTYELNFNIEKPKFAIYINKKLQYLLPSVIYPSTGHPGKGENSENIRCTHDMSFPGMQCGNFGPFA